MSSILGVLWVVWVVGAALIAGLILDLALMRDHKNNSFTLGSLEDAVATYDIKQVERWSRLHTEFCNEFCRMWT